MSKEYYRKGIADKRKEIVGLRADITELKERKKSKMESLARSIKSATGSNKEYYRKQKISEGERYNKDIERKKDKIEDVKKQIESHKKQLDRLK